TALPNHVRVGTRRKVQIAPVCLELLDSHSTVARSQIEKFYQECAPACRVRRFHTYNAGDLFLPGWLPPEIQQRIDPHDGFCKRQLRLGKCGGFLRHIKLRMHWPD